MVVKLTILLHIFLTSVDARLKRLFLHTSGVRQGSDVGVFFCKVIQEELTYRRARFPEVDFPFSLTFAPDIPLVLEIGVAAICPEINKHLSLLWWLMAFVGHFLFLDNVLPRRVPSPSNLFV